MFDDIISLENLLDAYRKAKRGKISKFYVQEFDYSLEQNIWQLHTELSLGKWTHQPYYLFIIHDPKKRIIRAAEFRDRIVHQAVCAYVEDIFVLDFIPNSYACIRERGVHRAVLECGKMMQKVMRQYQHCYVLQADIRKYFQSIDHLILKSLIAKKIHCQGTQNILEKIIDSHSEPVDYPQFFLDARRNGIPIGNLTSQLFGNIYLHELDKFVTKKLGLHNYLRYMDDFLLIHYSKDKLKSVLIAIQEFLEQNLRLHLHPKKTGVYHVGQHLDYLGYSFRNNAKTLRIRNRSYRRMRHLRKQHIRNIVVHSHSRESYLGAIHSWWGTYAFMERYQQYMSRKVFTKRKNKP